MLSASRLEAYMRNVAAMQYETVNVAPFALYFHPTDPFPHFSYAKPLEPVGGDLSEPLATLRAVFADRQRVPRFEFVEEFAPDLAPALRVAGFVEESKLHLMVCTPEAFRAAPTLPGVEIGRLNRESPLEDFQAFKTVQNQGFNPDSREVAAREEAEALRRQDDSAGALYLARLDGRPVSAGVYAPPIDGLTEVMGVATLEAFRRRGIASALVARAARDAFREGVEIAFLTAADERAGRAYERVGFRPYATMLAYRDEFSVAGE